MILLVHMLFGAAIGYTAKNIPLGIILAFFGHYFLDFFPHIEYLKSTEDSIKKIKNETWGKYLPDILKIALDFCLGIIIIFIFLKNQPIVYLYALVAIIPDGLTIITLLFPNKFLLWHHYIHTEKIHYFKHKKVSNFWRILTQILAVVVSIILLEF